MPTLPDSARKAALLAELRDRIRRIEGIGGGDGARVRPFGLAEVDSVLPEGGLPLGCLHEVAGLDGPATGFAAVLAAGLAERGPAVWIARGRDLYAPGLAAFGLGPERLIVVRAGRDPDILWAMEEALRCPQLGAVLGEVGEVGLVASRRLQLAAEAGGVTGLLLRRTATPGIAASSSPVRLGASAAVTRWRVAAVPSRTPPGEPGMGAVRWRLELVRCRGGRPGEWVVVWEQGALRVPEGLPAELPVATTGQAVGG